MSDLDTSVDELATVVDELIGAIAPPSDELEVALARITELNTQIAVLQANDASDAAVIASVTAERDGLVADQVENVAKVQAAIAKGKAALPTPVEPPVDQAPGDPVVSAGPED